MTHRSKVVQMIKAAYPGISNSNIHVWTLRGKSRELRLSGLWKQWEELGVHQIADGWTLPTGCPAFTSSGTYAPTFLVKNWKDDKGDEHVFLCDGYAASAEAVQAASLGPTLGIHCSLAVFSSKFELPWDVEHRIMRIDPDCGDIGGEIEKLFGEPLGEKQIEEYEDILREAHLANLPLESRTVCANDFFPQKNWRLLALGGYMQPDPYSGAQGVEKLSDDTYRVTVRGTTSRGDVLTKITLRYMEKTKTQRRLVFSPLLDRFMYGYEDFRTRAVKISDSGRIRNELQTLISTALEHIGARGIRIFFDRIPDEMMSTKRRKKLREILEWYKENHKIWFSWLEIA